MPEPATAIPSPATPELDAAGAAVVEVHGVSKAFQLPHQRYSTLKERALHPFRSRSFEELHAVRDVSFTIREGEFFGIVGRNGSGKSTLLKCLAGIYATDSGTIDISGRLSPFIELGVGFNAELTARDNVLLNATMLGLTRRQARDRFDAIIEFAELENFLDLKLKNYSSGMSVRLAFSVAIQVDADILLIDEVLAVGDAAFQQKCFDEFTRLKKTGKTIVFVTHDMSSVERFCDRAMLLERGEMVSLADPRQIARQYNELNFGGTASVPREAGRSGDRSVAEVSAAWFENAVGEVITAVGEDERVRLCMEVAFRADAIDPIFVLQFHNEHGALVFATSTDLHDPATGRYAAGSSIAVRAEMDVWLAPGRYFLTPAVAPAGQAGDLYDLRERLATVVVHGTRFSGAIVDFPHTLEIGPA
jgi:ABC-type polysaccharide/polyol phosphate transport system ATPase subunit